jgi:hypothetical protein
MPEQRRWVFDPNHGSPEEALQVAAEAYLR